MAQIKGYDGQLSWVGIADSDVAFNFYSWTLDVAGDTHDVTDFTSAGWRQHLGGLKGWTVTVELYTDSTNQVQPSDLGSSAQLRMYMNSTDYYRGLAICNGFSPAVAVDGVETTGLSFQGTSDLFMTSS